MAAPLCVVNEKNIRVDGFPERVLILRTETGLKIKKRSTGKAYILRSRCLQNKRFVF